MADLTTLDRTQPPDTQDRSQGALRIRETRDSILTSFAVEHDLAGGHKFIVGDPSIRPAAGIAGRLFINTTDERIERDTGSAWVIAHAVQGGYHQFLPAILTLAPTFLTVSTVLIDVPNGARIIAFASSIAQVSGSTSIVLGRVTVAGGAINPQDITYTPSGASAIPFFIQATDFTPPTGSVQVNCDMRMQSGTGSVDHRSLTVLVI